MLVILQIMLIMLQIVLIILQIILIILPLIPFQFTEKATCAWPAAMDLWCLEAGWRTKTAMSARQVRWPQCESGCWRDWKWRWKVALSATYAGQLLRHGWWRLSAVVRCWRESRLDNLLRRCQLSDWAVSLLYLLSHFLQCGIRLQVWYLTVLIIIIMYIL